MISGTVLFALQANITFIKKVVNTNNNTIISSDTCKRKLDSLIIVSPQFSETLDSLITIYSRGDSNFVGNNIVIMISFYERDSNVYCLVGANYFYSNFALSNSVGYLYFRKVLFLVSGDLELSPDGVFAKSTQFNNFKYIQSGSFEESLKIDDDTFPGYLFKNNHGYYEMVK